MLTLALSHATLLALLATGPSIPAAGPLPAADSLDDATIVAIFDAANTYDIESSGLAATRAAHPDVQALAKDFANAHTGVRQQGRDLAKKLGVTPTPPKNDQGAKDQAAAMAKLRAAKGEAFDRAYLEHEVAFHKAVIDAINQTLLPAIKNPELKALVLKVAPAFQGHLQAAQKLAAKYGATS
jgi:putative membrane protein